MTQSLKLGNESLANDLDDKTKSTCLEAAECKTEVCFFEVRHFTTLNVSVPTVPRGSIRHSEWHVRY